MLVQDRVVVSVLAFLLSLAGGRTAANPLKEPSRIIGEGRVDLRPLFQWWTNRTGPRPLKSWVHLTGLVVGTNSWGWVIEGVAEHSEQAPGQAKFILQHPPWGELIQFGQIKSQVDALTRQHSDL